MKKHLQAIGRAVYLISAVDKISFFVDLIVSNYCRCQGYIADAFSRGWKLCGEMKDKV